MARTLDGSTQYLSLANYLPFRALDRDFVVMVRFKRAANNVFHVLASCGNAASTSEGWTLLLDSDNTVQFRVNDGTNRMRVIGPTVTDTNWHTAIGIVNRTTGRLDGYLDGVGGWTGNNFSSNVTPDISSFGSIDPTGVMYFGVAGSAATGFFNGTLSECAILVRRIPTAQEIADWHSGIVAEKVFGQGWGCAGCWPLAGNSLVDVSNAVRDLTLTATATPTVAADPTLLWPGDVEERASSADTFTGSSGTKLTGRAADSGGSWAYHTSFGSTDLELDASGRLRRAVGATAVSMAYVDRALKTRGVRVECDLTAVTVPADCSPGLIARFSTAANTGFACQYNSGSGVWRVFTVNAGVTAASWDSPSFTPSGGTTYALRFEVVGGRAVLVVDGQLVATGRTTTTAITERRGVCGVRYAGASEAEGAGWRYDNFTVTELEADSATPSIGTLGGASSTYAGFHLPVLAATNDYILLGYEARLTGPEDTQPCDLLIQRAARPYDGTWGTAINFSVDGSGGSASFDQNKNLVLFVDPDGTTVRAMYVRSPNGVNETNAPAGNTDGGTTVKSAWFRTSTDQGATWGTATEITSQVKRATWAGFTIGPGQGLVIPSGTYAGRLVVGCHGNDEATHAVWTGHVAYSDDDGATWAYSDLLDGNPTETHLAYDPSSGRVYCLVRRSLSSSDDRDAEGSLILYSEDGGETWAALAEETEVVRPFDEVTTRSVFSPIYYDSTSRRFLITVPQAMTRQNLTIRYSDPGDITSWDDVADAARGRIVGGNRLNFAAQAYSDLIADPDDASKLIVGTIEGDRLTTAAVITYSDRLEVYHVPRSWAGTIALGGRGARRSANATAALIQMIRRGSR